MQIRQWIRSPSGRLAHATLGVALMTLGAVALAGPAHSIGFIAFVPPLLIVGGLVSVGLAVRDFNWEAIAMLVSLPFLAGLYLGALYAMVGAGAVVGAFLGTVGLALVVAQLLPSQALLPRRVTLD